MSTTAQIVANRENSLLSTGPKSPEGKTRVARNAVRLGLFTMNDFVLPCESAEHDHFCARFWEDLQPAGPVEETYATEMIRAAWRLRRCGLIEEQLAEFPEQNEANLRTQGAVDRARAQANNIFRRANNELRRLKAERRPAPGTAPAARDGFVFSPAAPPAPTEISTAKRSQFTARGAACPCGSGDKYKRCCGRNAPGLIHQAA